MYYNKDKNIEQIERPITPSDEDCCGSGCNPCIFDVHRTLLEQWEKKKKENITVSPTTNLLSPISYQLFQVSNISKACEDYIFIQFEYEGEIENDKYLHLIPGQYVIIRTSSLSKPYTPISWTNKSFLLLIKLYPHGRFSQLLSKTREGEIFYVRGPYGNFKYKPNSFQHVVMLSIGSGIAAVYPIAKAIVDDETEETRIKFIAGFHSPSHIPMKKELKHLSEYWNFICILHIAKHYTSENLTNLHGVNIKSGHINKQSIQDLLKLSNPDTTLILICGTNQFNQSVKDWAKEINYNNIHIFD